MKLADWLKSKNISVDDFAGMVSVRRQSVYRWIDDDKPDTERVRPGPRQMALIVEVTGGDVQPNDFWGAGAAPDSSETILQRAS